MNFRYPLAAAGLSVFYLLTGAAQETQAPAPPPPTAEEPEAPPPAADDENRTLEEIFTPSEEIRADEEVTFPINI